VLEELAELEAASGARLRQGFPLDAVLRAGRLEAQAMWEIVVAHARPATLATLATLTMQYLDLLNSVSERGYLHAREDMGRSLDEAIRLFLGRVVSGDFADEVEVDNEARLLGYDLSALRIGVVIEPRAVPSVVRSVIDIRLADVVRDLRRRFPDSPAGLVDLGIVLAVPGTSAEDVERILDSTIGDGDGGPIRLVAGLGSPRAGAQGMMISLREARRAQALGSLLEPQGRAASLGPVQAGHHDRKLRARGARPSAVARRRQRQSSDGGDPGGVLCGRHDPQDRRGSARHSPQLLGLPVENDRARARLPRSFGKHRLQAPTRPEVATAGGPGGTLERRISSRLYCCRPSSIDALRHQSAPGRGTQPDRL